MFSYIIIQKNLILTFSGLKDTPESKQLVPLHDNKVPQDFKEFFLKQEGCDVLIKVKGVQFSAHRTILSARSPVFASIFRNDMKEKSTDTIHIEDCHPSSFSDFLCFLYCGDIQNLSTENVFSLFIAADKYGVSDLRTKCIEFMKENLSVDTFCDTITLALHHFETELIKLATDFFTENLKKIIITIKWHSFIMENPMQGNELMIKALIPDFNKTL